MSKELHEKEHTDDFLLGKYFGVIQGRKEAEREQKAMCDTCTHKVSKEDLDAFRNRIIYECIEALDGDDCSISILEELKEKKE